MNDFCNDVDLIKFGKENNGYKNSAQSFLYKYWSNKSAKFLKRDSKWRRSLWFPSVFEAAFKKVKRMQYGHFLKCDFLTDLNVLSSIDLKSGTNLSYL